VRPAGGNPRPCGRCLQKPPPWQRLVAVNDYRPPLSGLIQQLKFHHRRSWGAGASAAAAFRSVTICRRDRMVGVPLWHRRRWRGVIIRATCCADR
jgi:predicted amidophosphoribosyltransferase